MLWEGNRSIFRNKSRICVYLIAKCGPLGYNIKQLDFYPTDYMSPWLMEGMRRVGNGPYNYQI